MESKHWQLRAVIGCTTSWSGWCYASSSQWLLLFGKSVLFLQSLRHLLPQTLAHKFQQSHRKCVTSFETEPDVYFMWKKKKASAQCLNELFLLFCCSTHPKMNKTALLPQIGGISSSDVIRRPMVDFIAAITCSAVDHRSITACWACLVLQMVAMTIFYFFTVKLFWRNCSGHKPGLNHDMKIENFLKAFTHKTRHLLIKLSLRRKL